MHAMALCVETEIHLAMQQAFEVQIGLLADQFQVKTVGLAERLHALEAVDLKIAGDPIQRQGEGSLIGRSEHPVFLCEGIGDRFCTTIAPC